MAGLFDWMKNRQRRYSPRNGVHYYISQEIIEFTTSVLQDYGSQKPKSEGIVYWAGRMHDDKWHVCSAVAPIVEASRYGFQTSLEANSMFVEFLSKEEQLYICQVHSHPAKWIDHSEVDDTETAFRSEGLLSLVVPSFGQQGMLPFRQCGIHLFTKRQFRRLSDRHIDKHFHVVDSNNPYSCILKDFRNG